jgi:hypothetical protein
MLSTKPRTRRSLCAPNIAIVSGLLELFQNAVVRRCLSGIGDVIEEDGLLSIRVSLGIRR